MRPRDRAIIVVPFQEFIPVPPVCLHSRVSLFASRPLADLLLFKLLSSGWTPTRQISRGAPNVTPFVILRTSRRTNPAKRKSNAIVMGRKETWTSCLTTGMLLRRDSVDGITLYVINSVYCSTTNVNIEPKAASRSSLCLQNGEPTHWIRILRQH